MATIYALKRSKNEKITALLFFGLLLACFFIYTKNSIAEEKTVIISAVQIYGQDANDDFIELYNNTCDDLDISDWKLRKRTSTGTDSSIKSFDDNLFIPAKGYFLWANSTNDQFANDMKADQSTKSGLSENYSIALFDQNDEQIDSLTWGDNSDPFDPTLSTPNPEHAHAILRNMEDSLSSEKDYSPKNSSDIENDAATSCPIEEEAADDPVEESDATGVRLNEILPNPKGDENKGEYIELYNDSDSSVDLKNWTLKDSSKTKFTFPPGHILKPNDYLAIYRDTFKFALNNTGSEDVYLLDPEENIVSQASYESAKENVSFGFDGYDWRWSKYLTPDKTNKFGASSKIKIEKIKEGYIGVPVEFALDPEYDSFSKVTWDFGDKKKSYLKNPTHTYLKKGKYTIKISASGETEDVSDSFTLKIKDYPRENVEIVSLLPNPFGSDAGQEWIEVRNNDQEIVNLKGWKLSAGQKTLINHLIKNDLEIGPGETIQLTRDQAFFTLNNASMILELRYPDGKTADKVTYAKEKIADDEIYVKEENGWIWFSAEEDVENEEVLSLAETESPTESQALLEEDSQGEVLGASIELGKFSISEEWKNKKRNRSHYLNYGLHIELASDFSEKTYSNNSLDSKPLPAHTKNEAFLEINAFLNKLLFN